MTRILLAAGSNAKGQLGIGSYDDAHTFTPCLFADPDADSDDDSRGRRRGRGHGHGLGLGHGLPDGSTVTQIACGANHTVLLLTHLDGSTTLWGAGDDEKGQLGGYAGGAPVFRKLALNRACEPRNGDGDGDGGRGGDGCGPGTRAFTRIAAAWETTYVVLSRPGYPESDMLLSMGSDDFGALGAGKDDRDAVAGGQTQGANSKPGLRVVDVGEAVREGETVCIGQLCAGPRHAIARLVLTNAGSGAVQSVLVGWGASRHGQLGGSAAGVRFVARPVVLPVDVQTDPMVSCVLGNQHTVVLHASGRLTALGSNKQGQIPDASLVGRRVGCTWNGTYVETDEGVRSVGSNTQGQLGRGVDAASVCLPKGALSDLACGSEHVLVSMFKSGCHSVLGWGWNEHGNMGLGSVGNIASPTQLWPREVEGYGKYPQRVIDIWAGCATSWLLVE